MTAVKVVRRYVRLKVATPGPRGAKGTPGDAGVIGRSAYESAVDNGFEGSETEWLDYLRQGPQGPKASREYPALVSKVRPVLVPIKLR
jgi:hypothetical protein